MLIKEKDSTGKGEGKMIKTVLITGASSGIGREMAKLFARDKFRLILVARDEKRLQRLSEEFQAQYGTETKLIAKDLSDAAAAGEIHAECRKDGLHVDILVNNAGFNVYGPFFEADPSKTMAMIQVNLTSLTHLTRLFLPEMVKRGTGNVLNIGSTGSFAPGPFNAVYCATKAYVLSFSEAIAEELRGTGVKVTVLCPGATETEFARRAGMEDTRIFLTGAMGVKKVAECGYQSLQRGRQIVAVPGILNKVTVVSIRFSPRFLVGKLGRYLMSRVAA
jgi:short-subunit dehydrogenase